MAYAALVSLAQTLDQIVVRHSFFAQREKQQIQSLHDKIVFLSNFLEEFPREATKLEARITVAANRVEDAYELHILSRNLEELYNDLQKPIKVIDSILKEGMQIKSSNCTSENEMMSSHYSASFSSTLPHNVKGDVVGFENNLMDIKDRLYGVSAKLEVIPIVGMGGIGKTTLAWYALHDPFALHHFDVSALVSVSQNYDKASILLRLLNSIDASSKGQFEGMIFESLLEHVYKYLKGRRFLIVVDDIWNANTWDDFRRVFPDDLNGSRIIITTRDVNVASYADTCSHSYKMHFMSVDLGWNLLRQKVFEEEQCPPELEEIGRWIVEQCRGLPLAIVVIAGVLSKLNRMQDSWRQIAGNVNEAVNTSCEPFAEILSLSYTCLPHRLRPCFLYMGAYPEDHEIHVSELIRLWVAEGFLKSNGSKDLEEVAEDYLEELAKRSLVLINKKRYNGKIKSIKMHDLLRDLCLRKAADEKFLRVVYLDLAGRVSEGMVYIDSAGRFSEGIRNSRRISLRSLEASFKGIKYLPIHTIIAFNILVSMDSLKCCRLLRVVNLKYINLRSLGNEIGELLHLRYLAVTFIPPSKKLDMFEIPKSFSKLVNLQTLIIHQSFSIKICWPLGIWRMPELRNIIIQDVILPDPSAQTCDQILPLEKLHTLKRIHGFRCSERVLELIPNLNKLGIIYSSGEINKTTWSEYGLSNLVHLQKLENLKLYADQFEYTQSDLSQSLAFPVTLQKLTLRGTAIPWEDMSVVGSLPNLQVLKLRQHACRGTEWETIEGQFNQLKVLVIDETDPHHWITKSSHFPRLERLLLYRCDNLREIPSDIGEIATLQLIEVDCCNSSVVESAKYIEEEQHSFGNDLQLHLKMPPIS